MLKSRKILFLFLLLISLLLCSVCAAGENVKGSRQNLARTKISKPVAATGSDTIKVGQKENRVLRIALCHLDVSQGPQETNIKKIEKAIRIAGGHGANWILTPETALQGYYFYVIDPSQKENIETQPSESIRPLLDASSKYGSYLFLGAGERDEKANCYRNSCLVFGPDGKLVGRHSKLSAHVGFGAEKWSTNDCKLEPIVCSNVKTGVLACSDIWFLQFPRILADKGAKIILDLAAWPPTKETGDPRHSWELASQRTNLPVVICNQTGKPRWMDMTPGQSTVIENGKAKFLYSGEEAVLLFEWDPKTGKVVSKQFAVIPFKS